MTKIKLTSAKPEAKASSLGLAELGNMEDLTIRNPPENMGSKHVKLL